MKILFMHPEFPGQFMHLVVHLAKDSSNQVVFITQQKENRLSNVTKVIYSLPPQNPATHPFLESMERALLHSLAAARAARMLKEKGFMPDLIYGYTGG